MHIDNVQLTHNEGPLLLSYEQLLECIAYLCEPEEYATITEQLQHLGIHEIHCSPISTIRLLRSILEITGTAIIVPHESHQQIPEKILLLITTLSNGEYTFTFFTTCAFTTHLRHLWTMAYSDKKDVQRSILSIGLCYYDHDLVKLEPGEPPRVRLNLELHKLYNIAGKGTLSSHAVVESFTTNIAKHQQLYFLLESLETQVLVGSIHVPSRKLFLEWMSRTRYEYLLLSLEEHAMLSPLADFDLCHARTASMHLKEKLEQYNNKT